MQELEDFFLTSEKKEYYMKDFENLLVYKEKEFWNLDEGLSEILIKLNGNKSIQTLYSKKFEKRNDSFGVERKSYLQVCYSKDVKEKLFKALAEVEGFFDGAVKIFNNQPNPQNPNKRGNKIFGIACIDDNNYFNIHNFKIEIESYSVDSHETFWKLLELKLSSL